MKLSLVAFLLVEAFAIPQEKIIGGQNADPQEIPYQVSIQLKALDIEQHICGGTIINKNWVITSATCVTELPIPPFFKPEFWVRAGIVKLSDSAGQKIKVVDKVLHPDFSGGRSEADLALLQLETPLEFNEAVRAVEMPIIGSEFAGYATVSGWGATKNSFVPEPSDFLKKADVLILPNADCSKALTDAAVPDTISDRQICTAPPAKVCIGDNGNPLVQEGYLIGISSWESKPCSKGGMPGVYTKVEKFVNFIMEVVVFS